MIGIFDSGIGGISILNEILRRLPSLDCHYVADTACFPYGRQRQEDIVRRSHAIVRFLLDKACRLVVLACNSATGAAIENLRRSFSVPLVGIEPAVKVAQRHLDNGPIGVLCTDLTSSGAKYRRLLESQGLRDHVVTHTSPELARVIEEGVIQGDDLRRYLFRELEPFRHHRIGCLVLGCTHYAFVREQIEDILQVPVVEPAPAVARRTIDLYPGETPPAEVKGVTWFHATGPLDRAKTRASSLLTRPPAGWYQVTIPAGPRLTSLISG